MLHSGLVPTYEYGNASHWLPENMNPPCTCPHGQHQPDAADGKCYVPNDNNPASMGYCPCQHSARTPVTQVAYEAWQADIRDGLLLPDDMPDKKGYVYGPEGRISP